MATGTKGKYNKIKKDAEDGFFEAIYGTPKVGDYYYASDGGKGGTKKYIWNGTTWKQSMMVHPDIWPTDKSTEWYTDEMLAEAKNLHNAGTVIDPETGLIVQDLNNNPLPIPELDGYNDSFSEGFMEGSYKVCRYPSDIVRQDTDYVMFNFYEYVPPFGSDVNKNFIEGYDEATKKEKKNMVLNQTLANYNASVATAKKAENYPSVLLYMPDDVGDAFSASWEGKAFGNVAAGIIAAGGAKGGIDGLGKIAGALRGAVNRLSPNTVSAAITNLAKSITGDTITTGDVFSSTQGVVRNPNVEVLFQQMSLRTFDLTFRMSPYNKVDELHIKQLISAFKRAMLPSYSTGSVFGSENRDIQAAFVKVPKLVQVAYMRGSQQNPHLPKYKLCALTDVNINYTPDNNYATFNQAGGPVSYELKLNFMETKLVFSEEIATGNH